MKAILINGAKERTERTLVVQNPATGTELQSVASADRSDTKRAITAAQAGLEDWRHTPPAERERPLRRTAQRIEETSEDVATLLSKETGKCIGTARGEVEETIAQFRFYAGVVDKVRGDTIPTPNHRLNYTRRVPYGVTAHIVPWNYPLLLGTRSIAAALATGNTVVAKAPSQAPLTTLWIGEILLEELPEGVINVLAGPGSEVGAELSSNSTVDAISFTGSTKIGQRVLTSAADNITRVDLELGGKTPAIVLPDTDVENAARGITTGIFSNSGQNCVATSRAIVHEDVKSELVERILEKTRRISLGPGTDPETDMGPVISESALESILEHVQVAVDEGATLRTGGKRSENESLSNGYFVEPTVFDDVDPTMRIATEEVFGPILSVIPVTSCEQAIEVANDSQYALAASLWTERLDATQLADELDHGIVAVNTFPVSMPQSPWGGNKHSGIGREGGLEGVDAFTTVDSIIIEHGRMEDPYQPEGTGTADE